MKLAVYLTLYFVLVALTVSAQVNVFLGTSGDHGQLSPAASYPFSMLDIGPQTYPNTHTGYEHKAKLFLGFTHGRLEGVGCMGSGGNILIKPILFKDTVLIKKTEQASPGYYEVGFQNGIDCRFTLKEKSGIEQYHFPSGPYGFQIDLAHTLMNGFKDEQHIVSDNGISGWVESGTTCRVGAYRIYYAIQFDQLASFTDTGHRVTVRAQAQDITLRIAFSSISENDAKATINHLSFAKTKAASAAAWDEELNRIRVTGDPKEKALFESLLYRCFQAPFNISEHQYSGWTIWDNYKTTLPLLSLIAPDRYQDMVTSIAKLYKTGKKNWATKTEPCNTVRTEHAMVVLLDAYRKGYQVDFQSIKDSLLKEAGRLDFTKPDKALESCYDEWAMSQILGILREDSLSKVYLDKAARWKSYWNKDFKDLSQPDVDDPNARHMYQGTIWQYRWFCPFDQKGLIEACGGEKEYLKQLDEFFGKDYYNAANEPDIQVPYMYSFTSQPWRSQDVIHKYAQDTVIQYYEDDNYRGIDPQIKRVYNNRTDGFLQTMDDDMGAMSAWYILAAIGLSPACVGTPVYYLHVPLFRTVTFGKLNIIVKGNGRYIHSVTFNGKNLDRNWLTQLELSQGGNLIINASNVPNKNFGINNQFITSIYEK